MAIIARENAHSKVTEVLCFFLHCSQLLYCLSGVFLHVTKLRKMGNVEKKLFALVIYCDLKRYVLNILQCRSDREKSKIRSS